MALLEADLGGSAEPEEAGEAGWGELTASEQQRARDNGFDTRANRVNLARASEQGIHPLLYLDAVGNGWDHHETIATHSCGVPAQHFGPAAKAGMSGRELTDTYQRIGDPDPSDDGVAETDRVLGRYIDMAGHPDSENLQPNEMDLVAQLYDQPTVVPVGHEGFGVVPVRAYMTARKHASYEEAAHMVASNGEWWSYAAARESGFSHAEAMASQPEGAR